MKANDSDLPDGKLVRVLQKFRPLFDVGYRLMFTGCLDRAHLHPFNEPTHRNTHFDAERICVQVFVCICMYVFPKRFQTCSRGWPPFEVDVFPIRKPSELQPD